MSNENNQPLSINLSLGSIQTAIPRIADGAQPLFRLTDVNQVSAEGKPDNLKFTFELVNPAQSTEGTPITPGSPGSKHIEFVPTQSKPDAKDPTWHLKKISNIVDALLGTAQAGHASKPTRPDLNAETLGMLLGKEAYLTMKAKTGEYADRGNEVSRFTYPGDLKA